MSNSVQKIDNVNDAHKTSQVSREIEIFNQIGYKIWLEI